MLAELTVLRDQIDEVDKALPELLAKRLELVAEVGEVKNCFGEECPAVGDACRALWPGTFGLHPMYGPDSGSLAKQVVVYCDGRQP